MKCFWWFLLVDSVYSSDLIRIAPCDSNSPDDFFMRSCLWIHDDFDFISIESACYDNFQVLTDSCLEIATPLRQYLSIVSLWNTTYIAWRTTDVRQTINYDAMYSISVKLGYEFVIRDVTWYVNGRVREDRSSEIQEAYSNDFSEAYRNAKVNQISENMLYTPHGDWSFWMRKNNFCTHTHSTFCTICNSICPLNHASSNNLVSAGFRTHLPAQLFHDIIVLYAYLQLVLHIQLIQHYM